MTNIYVGNCAFVETSDGAAVQAAIRGVNGTELGGRALNANEARPKTEGGGRRR